MKKIVVCDDDTKSITYIKKLLENYMTTRKVEGEIIYYRSGKELIESENIDIDIAILDVEMNGINGIQTGYEIQRRYPDAILIIITAFMRYLDDAMDLRVFRYFEKPVDRERLFLALDIALKEHKLFPVSTKKEIELIREDQIVCISIKLRNTAVFLSNGETLYAKISLKKWLKMLEGNNSFGMPHSSFIVNFNYVRKFGIDYIVVESKTGKQLKIYASKRKYPEFKKAFNEKMREFI